MENYDNYHRDTLSHIMPIKCNLNEDKMTGTWLIQYSDLFKDTPDHQKPPWLHDTVMAASCVPGCNSDTDCPAMFVCEAVFEDCKSPLNCPLGTCVAKSCTNPPKSLGGHLLESYRNQSVADVNTFKCKEGYTLSGLKITEIVVKCSAASGSVVSQTSDIVTVGKQKGVCI